MNAELCKIARIAVKGKLAILYVYAGDSYIVKSLYTEKNLFVNFTYFIRKFIIFIVALGHTQNVGFLLLKIVIFIIFVANFSSFQIVKFATKIIKITIFNSKNPTF